MGAGKILMSNHLNPIITFLAIFCWNKNSICQTHSIISICFLIGWKALANFLLQSFFVFKVCFHLILIIITIAVTIAIDITIDININVNINIDVG